MTIEGCSPYALSVGILIGIFIGREDIPEQSEELFEAGVDQSSGWDGGPVHQQEHEPLAPPPSPLQYRILSTVIADQVQAIGNADEKSLGQLQDEIREAFSHSEYGRSIADRLGRRLLLVRSPDDLIDLAGNLGYLLVKPSGEEIIWAGHGRDRPMYLRPDSVFGVFLRRLKAACDRSSFAHLCGVYEEVVRYCSSLRQRPGLKSGRSPSSSAVDMDMVDDVLVDLESPRDEGGPFGEEGLSGGGALGNFGGGHINAFMSQQGIAGGGGGFDEKRDVDDANGGEGRGVFPREVSAWQLQRRLQNKALQLEKRLGSRVPFEDIEGEVQAALRSRSDVPRAHFMRFMNCMLHRDLEGSLDSLHRYFDYAVRRGGPSMSGRETFLELASDVAQGRGGRHIPQHAALALARLHFEFGNLELASLALGEAIRVAQQSGDKACVAQAMGWLYQMLAAQGHPRAGDVLRRCASQAVDLDQHQLMHSAILLLAREAAVAKNGSPARGGVGVLASSMAEGGGNARGREHPSPARVWECLAAVASGDLRGLLESEVTNIRLGLLESMASGAGGDRPADEFRGGTACDFAAGLSCQRLLVEAGAFERYGYSGMAAACARSVLQVLGDVATASNVELASACVINAVLRGKHVPGLPGSFVPPPPPPQGNGGGMSGKVDDETKEDEKEEEKEGSGSRDEGEAGCVFEVALSVALLQHEAFPHPVSNLWAAGVMLLLHEWMINRGEFRAAEGLGMSLRGCCPISRGVEAFVEARLQRVRLLRAQHRWNEAVEAASELLKISDTRGLAPQYARLLLELSRARLGAEPVSPVGALPHALRCLAVCESYSLDEIHASAMTHLAEVHFRMGSIRRARILLKACLGQLLANAPMQTKGEAWLSMAKCEIAEVSLDGSPSPDEWSSDSKTNNNESLAEKGGQGSAQRREDGARRSAKRAQSLRRAVLHLDRAIAMLKHCHDFAGLRECLYLKARVCGKLASEAVDPSAKAEATAERNASAKSFLAVSRAWVRALALPSPGMKITPVEIRRYMRVSMASIPWS